MSRRMAIIEIGKQALREIETDPHGESQSSLVFEDAFREIAPRDLQYLADNIQAQRGYSGERLSIRYAIQRLEELPLEQAVKRAEAKIGAMLRRAWKAGVISRADEDHMSILKYLPNHIKAGLSHRVSKSELRREIVERSFRLSRHSPPAQRRLAQRVSDAIYEEGLRLTRELQSER
jgi:hypothetical protein